MPNPIYTVTPVEWNSKEAEACRAIRLEVFVDEQQVPIEMEIDDIDPIATHVLATDPSGTHCGTGRLFPDPAEVTNAKIGRMAVIKSARGTGCGSALLQALLDIATKQGYRKAVLSAQDHAVLFYQKFGFEVQGDFYLDANIPHFTMTRDMSKG